MDKNEKYKIEKNLSVTTSLQSLFSKIFYYICLQIKKYNYNIV